MFKFNENLIVVLKPLLIVSITIASVLQANPPAIDIFNLTKENVQFTISLSASDRKSAPVSKLIVVKPSIQTHPATRYAAPNNFTIQSIRVYNTNIKLDLGQYSEKVGIVYHNNILMEESAYNNYKTSRIEQLKQRASALLAGLYTGITNKLTSIRKTWKQWRASRQPQYYTSGLNQIVVHNKLPYIVTVRGGGQDKEIESEESNTFVKSLEQLDIYDAPTASHEKTLITMIDLTSYQKNPKKNHNLVVILRDPTWYEKWYRKSPISYDIAWKADTVEGTPALGYSEKD